MAKYYKLNQNIQAQELRVIDADGTQLGVISKEEAVKRALDQGLDLVEVAPNAKPPVAKILDFEKFKYEESKKEQAAKKHSQDVELKELWFTPRIAEHDVQTRLNRIDEFISDNNKVQLTVKFKGREMAHPELGFAVINKIFEYLGDKIVVEREPKLEGRRITAIIGRSTGNKQKDDKAEEIQDQNQESPLQEG